jgi:protein kinase C substrate 80K-H
VGEQTYGSWGGKHDFAKMIYADGERCWSGPARSTEVRVVCGPTNEVLSVDEPSMCTYKMVFQTPAICE